MPACPRCGSSLTDGDAPCPRCASASEGALRAIQEALESVSRAREAGVEVEPAAAALTEAQEALAEGNEGAARERAREAKALAEEARRRARATGLVERQRRDLARGGGDLSEAMGHLTRAESALAQGLYGEVQDHVRRSRESAVEARRRASAREVVRREVDRLQAEAGRGLDVAAATAILEQVRQTIEAGDLRPVRDGIQQARREVRLGRERKKVEDALSALREELAELTRQGAEGASAREALEAVDPSRNLPGATQALARARRAVKAVREQWNRDVIVAAVQRIVERATRGDLTAQQARDLIREVQEALAKGQAVELERLLEARTVEGDSGAFQRVTLHLQEVTGRLLTLRRAEIDLEGAEEVLSRCRALIEEGKLPEAEALLADLDETTLAMLDNVRDSTAAMIERASGVATGAREEGLDVEWALSVLQAARQHFEAERLPEALEMTKSAETAVAAALARHRETARRAAEDEAREARVRTTRLRERLRGAAQDAAVLQSAELDTRPARTLLESATHAADTNQIEEAERLLTSAEAILSGLWVTLRRQAEAALRRAETQATEGLAWGVLNTQARTLLGEARRAFEEKHFKSAVELAEAFVETVERARLEKAADQSRRAQEQMTRVRLMLDQLRSAMSDEEADADLQEAQRALRVLTPDNVEAQLILVERVAERLRERLRGSAEAALEAGRSSIEAGARIAADVDDAQLEYETGQELLAKGDFEAAARHARNAERRAVASAERRRRDLDQETRRRADAARAMIARMKRIGEDLARADIQMEGSASSLQEAEAALERGDPERVETALEPFLELAATLTEGLKSAAETFLEREHLAILAAKAEGLEVPRAEKVLHTAQHAVTQERFVEALEYHKVIDDILQDARRQRDLAAMEAELRGLREELVRAGASERAPEIAALLETADGHLRSGSFEEFRAHAAKAREALDRARRAIRESCFAEMRARIQAARETGADVGGAERVYAEAQEATLAGRAVDLAEALRRITDLAEQARRVALRSRGGRDLREVRDLLDSSARAGIDVAVAEDALREAEEAFQEGAYDRLAAALAHAREVATSSRREHLGSLFQDRLAALSATLDTAGGLGVAVADARAKAELATQAAGAGDFEAAELALARAQVAADREVQRWLGTRHPDLTVHFPRAGLEHDRWNLCRLVVENRGPILAREVTLRFLGDVDVEGLRPIREVPAGGRATLDVGLRPHGAGDAAIRVEASYRRVLDDAEYAAAEECAVSVQDAGTYAVEDAFLIHADGRLLCHAGGRFRHVDEDIFSGMLSVVQDFVRDAFRGDARGGLRRFEFGGKVVLLERSRHAFVAVILQGRPPELLPLYMAEILRQVEERWGAVLEGWRGILQDLEGIEEVTSRLLLVTDDPKAPVGALEDSPVTAALRALARTREAGADGSEVEALLDEARRSVDGDIEIAWRLVERAGSAAERAEQQVETHLSGLVGRTSEAVTELRRLGADMGQAQLLLREAEEANAAGDLARVREISEHLARALEAARHESGIRGLQGDLQALIAEIEKGRAQHLDLGRVEEVLVQIQEGLASRDAARAETLLRQARQLLAEEVERAASQRVQEELGRIARLLTEAADEGLHLSEVREILDKATEAVSEGRDADARTLLGMLRENVEPKIQRQLLTHGPRLFAALPVQRHQVGERAPLRLLLENRGTAPATALEFEIEGPWEAAPPARVDRLDPGEQRTVEATVVPRQAGAAPLGLRIAHRRPLSDTPLLLAETQEVPVSPAETYPVARVLLLDAQGVRLADAAILPGGDDALVEELHERIRAAFPAPESAGLRRHPRGEETVVLEKGPGLFLAVVCRGREPAALPLFMVECLRAVGEDASAAGREAERLLWVSDDPAAPKGALERSPLLSTVVLVGTGGDSTFLERARSVIEQRDFASALAFVTRAEATTVVRGEEIRALLNAAVSTGGQAISEEEMARVVDLVKRVVSAIHQARAKAGLSRHWPLRRVAVRVGSGEDRDTVESFRKIISTQTLARNLEVLREGQTWRGMDLKVHFHADQMTRIYKSWARRVELSLQRQDPWKIKAGIDKGEYSVGIEGQKVAVKPEAVSFEVSLPAYCVEEPFEGGVIYADARTDGDIPAEGAARELAAAVREARGKAGVTAGEAVAVTVEAPEGLASVVAERLDLVRAESKASSVTFGKVEKGTEQEVAGERVRIAVAVDAKG